MTHRTLSSAIVTTIFFAMTAILPAHVALAAHGAGNGGEGVILKDGTIALLDFVEAGIENKPALDGTFNSDPAIAGRLQAALADIDAPVDALSRKLEAIGRTDRMFELVLVRAIEMYGWVSVDRDLVDPQDARSPLQFKPGEIVQLAIRTARTIRINRSYYSKLDVATRAGLILHEAVFAVTQLSDSGHGLFQDSQLARTMTAFLFSRRLMVQGYDGLTQASQGKYLIGLKGFKARADKGSIFSHPRIRYQLAFTERRHFLAPATYAEHDFVDAGAGEAEIVEVLENCQPFKYGHGQEHDLTVSTVEGEGDLTFDSYSNQDGSFTFVRTTYQDEVDTGELPGGTFQLGKSLMRSDRSHECKELLRADIAQAFSRFAQLYR